jgi:glutamate synthase domain-containing protein 3
MLGPDDATTLRALVVEHANLTQSPRARAMLSDWPTVLRHFFKVVPISAAASNSPAPAETKTASELSISTSR